MRQLGAGDGRGPQAMLIAGEKPPLLILDPAGAGDGRAAKKSLARLTYPMLQLKDAAAAAASIANGYPAVVLIVAEGPQQEVAAMCSRLFEAATSNPPAMVLLSGKPLTALPGQLAAQFVAPFDWEAIVDRVDQLLQLAMLRRDHSALGALLQLSRVELVSVDTESQTCRVNDTLAVLLALPGADSAVNRRDRLQPLHWQKLFNHCDEPDRQRWKPTAPARSGGAGRAPGRIQIHRRCRQSHAGYDAWPASWRSGAAVPDAHRPGLQEGHYPAAAAAGVGGFLPSS